MEEMVVTVKMGELDVVKDESRLKTVLGSCVGVILRDPGRRVSGLAHVILPARQRGDTAGGKYADTAIPALVARIVGSGGRQRFLEALLVGGAQMFPQGAAAIASIGEQNVHAARGILGRLSIPVVFEDTGGQAGRRVIFENVTGRVSVKTLRAMEAKGEGK
jgi:chemotaxis protein CheD